MFIRASRSQGRTYLRLVEGYRDADGKSRQRQIAQLGRADALTEDKVHSIIRGLKRHTGLPLVDADTAHFEPSRSLGAPWLLTEIWRSLGLDKGLQQALRSSYRQFDLEGVIRAMVLNRLCDPSSKLGVLRWLERVHLPGVDLRSIDHNQLLRAMDALIEHREAAEAIVAHQLRPLLDQELSVVFYDITTVPIHGEHHVDGDLRQPGLSKDTHGIHRQFALGVIQTAEGLPIAHEVFEGNVAETKTLAPMITRLLERFRLERVVVVADRGLLSLDNVDTLEALGREQGLAVDYILAVPGRRYGEFTDLMDRLHPVLAEQAQAAGEEAVTETTWQGRRLVVAHNPERAAEQSANRRRRIERVDELGQRLAQRLDNQDAGKAGRGRRSSDRSAYQRFHKAVIEQRLSGIIKADLAAPRFHYDIDEAAWAAAERLDGKLLLVTSLNEREAGEIVARYRSLADIERGFRALKSTLEIAPVHHRLPDRIRAHALICFLALVLYRVLHMRLKADASLGLSSVERLLESLESVQLHQLHLDGEAIQGISMSAAQRDLFKRLEVRPPHRDTVA
ncbi:IS1634 family transposase [Arhodomonas sp. AD133]|uniref:IS1634 family transposase n=1 Tax=Arhodomonas sp. AD133 TaxID=3415009 RepID=UPI003EB8BC2C